MYAPIPLADWRINDSNSDKFARCKGKAGYAHLAHATLERHFFGFMLSPK